MKKPCDSTNVHGRRGSLLTKLAVLFSGHMAVQMALAGPLPFDLASARNDDPL